MGLIKSGAPPYVEFAVWGPRGYRLKRKSAPHKFTIDNRWNPYAPLTYGMWEQCYKWLKTGLIMLKAVGTVKILKYHENQKTYHEWYGPECRHTQYKS